jgi:hypothetical protein
MYSPDSTTYILGMSEEFRITPEVTLILSIAVINKLQFVKQSRPCNANFPASSD